MPQLRTRISRETALGLALACGCLAATACRDASPPGSDPGSSTAAPPAPPAETADTPAPPITSQDPDGKTAAFLGYTAPKPATWAWKPPLQIQRVANYVVPGRSGSNQAELIVYHGIDGSAETTIARWAGQFRGPAREPVHPTVEIIEVDGVPVTLAELTGAQMRQGAQWYTDDQLLLAAIVEAPDGAIHITLAGDHATVEPAHEAFTRFVRGLRRAE